MLSVAAGGPHDSLATGGAVAPELLAAHKLDPTPVVTHANPVGSVLLCYTGGTLGMVRAPGGAWMPQLERGSLAVLIKGMPEFSDDAMPDLHMVE